jgi:hypothetical protein
MKKILYLGLAFLVFGFLALPAFARANSHGKSATHIKTSKASKSTAHSNKGGTVKGLERAEEVQAANSKADAKRGFTVAPGVEKAEGETVSPGKKAKGKSALHTGSTGDKDQDESKD